MPPPPPPPARTSTNQRTFQRRGALIAIALAAAFLAVILFFTLRPRPTPVAAAEDNPTDIVIRPGESRPGGEGVRIDLVDKKNPGRKAGLLVLDRMDPDPDRPFYFNVAKPEAFLYLADGSTAYIRADSGSFYMPDERGQPESGSLSGHVLGQVFPAREDGKPADPKTDTPLRTLATESMQFDSALVEASTEDPFRYTTQEGMQIDAVGFRLSANQVQQRLEKFVSTHGGRIYLKQLPDSRQAQKPAPKPAPAHAVAPGAARGDPAPTPAPKPLPETLYRMTFERNVRFLSGQRTGNGDTLELWARFIGNKLPENAITEIKTVKSARDEAAPRPGSTPGTAPTRSAGATTPAPTPGAPPAQPADAPQEITMTWEGPCTIIPLETAPPELEHDHVAVRFSADAGGHVDFRDAGRHARAATVSYGLTSTRLTLDTPPRPEFDPAVSSLLVDADNRAAAWRIEHTLKTGITHIPGAGELTGPQGLIPWSDQADFEFFLGPAGEVTSALKQAGFSGNVHATARDGRADGSFLRAEFALLPAAPGAAIASALTRLQLHDGGAGSDQSGSIHARVLDVLFKPTGRGAAADPVSLAARGAVHVEREPSTLDAEELDADLARNPAGKTDITHVEARTAVRYADSSQGIGASTDTLRADLSWEPGSAPTGSHFPRRQVIDLISATGESSITQQDATITSTILSRQMRLDGVARTMNAFGPGSFTRADPAAKDGPADLTATWSQSMSFNDATGRIECIGDATAVSHPDPSTLQTARGDSIYLNITPAAESGGDGRGAALGGPAGGPAKGGPARELLKAEAVGTVLTRDGGTPASVEMRRYLAPRDPAVAEQDRAVQELYYLEGPRILADNAAQTMDVPGPGKLLLVDQRPEATIAQPGARRANPLTGSSERGSSLFDWTGSLHMDRGAGTVQLRRTVHLTHKNTESPAQVTNLTCEMLVAKIREIANREPGAGSLSAGADPTAKAELVSATATGAVYLTAGPERTGDQHRPPRREMIADTLEYDAINRTVDARAAEGNSVMVYDPKQPTPASAQRFFWNLVTDRIEIKAPGAIVAPAPAR